MVLFLFPFPLVIPVALFFALRRWFRGPTKGTDNPKRLDGRVVVITGGNAGIGAETARDLANRGARVIMLCRDVEKANSTKSWIKSSNPDARVEVANCNLASLESIRLCVDKLKTKITKVDYLINNAGVMQCPLEWKTDDGFDMQLGVNHLGHVLLTELLLPLLRESAKTYRPRIVILSSMAHYNGTIKLDDLNFEQRAKTYPFDIINTTLAYNQSKLANVLHAKALAKLLKNEGINTYSLHPGVIPASDLFRHIESLWVGWFFKVSGILPLSKYLLKRNIDGAQTTLFCVLDDTLENESGEYYSDCTKVKPNPAADDQDLIDNLYVESLALVGIKQNTL